MKGLSTAQLAELRCWSLRPDQRHTEPLPRGAAIAIARLTRRKLITDGLLKPCSDRDNPVVPTLEGWRVLADLDAARIATLEAALAATTQPT